MPKKKIEYSTELTKLLEHLKNFNPTPLQDRMFKAIGMSKEDVQSQFGFFLEAFKYGLPPHGGIAFGLDRLVAIMGGNEIIRDFIAFPKNNSGRDIMIDSPSSISEEQLKEINLKTREFKVWGN